jgi:cytochrome c oxidase assembly protein subunit 15
VPQNASAPPTAALTLFRLAALFTFLAVAIGAVVCATGSGASCPTWPGCRPDEIAPQWQLSPLIEFTHRVVAMASGPLVLAAAVMSRRLPGPNRWARILPLVALVGALAAGAFGRLVVLSGLPTWLGAVDLFCALTAMTAMGVAAALVGSPDSLSRSTTEFPPTQIERLAAMSLTVVVAMHVSGIFAAGSHSYTRCMGWPIWHLIDSDLHPWLQDLRLGLAGLGAALVLTTAVAAARNERLRWWGIVLATLFTAEMVLGLVIRAYELNAGVAAAYSVLAVALLSCLGLLMAVAWSTGVDTDATPLKPAPPRREPAAPVRR